MLACHAFFPKKALATPVVLLAPASVPANRLFVPGLLKMCWPPMLYCLEVSIAPAAVIAAPEPVFAIDRVKPGSPLVKESGTAIFGALTAPFANSDEVTAFVAI